MENLFFFILFRKQNGRKIIRQMQCEKKNWKNDTYAMNVCMLEKRWASLLH